MQEKGLKHLAFSCSAETGVLSICSLLRSVDPPPFTCSRRSVERWARKRLVAERTEGSYPRHLYSCSQRFGKLCIMKRVSKPKQQFGGDWTEEKLERVRKYLVAYATIMTKHHFRFAYIDAFAGTGYNMPKVKKEEATGLFPELASPDAKQLLDGSARIALRVE